MKFHFGHANAKGVNSFQSSKEKYKTRIRLEDKIGEETNRKLEDHVGSI